MATLDSPVTLRNTVMMSLAGRLVKAANKDKRATAHTWMQTTVKLVMHVAGFACLTIAGFAFNFAAGMIVAGVSCFFLSWLMTSTTSNTPLPRDPRLR